MQTLLLADMAESFELETEQSLDALDLSRILYRHIRSAMDATGFFLGLYDETTGMVEVVRQIDRDVEKPGGAFPLGSGFTSQVIRTRQLRRVGRWSDEAPPPQVQYASDDKGLPESAITVPIIGLASDAVLGVLAVQSFAPFAYSEADEQKLLHMANLAAQAIERWRRAERAQADLARRTAEMEAILTSMSEGLIITDARGSVTRFNAAARELLLGTAGRIVVGASLGQLSDTEPLARALAQQLQALRDGHSPNPIEVEANVASQWRTLNVSASPLRDWNGGVILLRDVTEQRAMDRLKAQVLRIASHDLQSPL